MPNSAPKQCAIIGCGVLAHNGARCDRHIIEHNQQYAKERGSPTARGYSYRWTQESKRFLRAHPLCQCPDCMEGDKRVTRASVVDHIIPHRGDPVLFWDQSNWQSMSIECHNSKTARGQ